MESQDIARTMKSWRGRSLLTRKQVEEATGIKEGVLTKWESGMSMPTAISLVTLAELYGCSVDELVGR